MNKNPKYDFHNPSAWAFAGECKRKGMAWNETAEAARVAPNIDTDDVLRARREIGYKSDYKQDRLRERVARRLPLRPTKNRVPFYLRNKYTFSNGTHVPDINYREASVKAVQYAPKNDMEYKLFVARLKYTKETVVHGLVRWPFDIRSQESSIVITKDYSNFLFKVTHDKPGLPKEHTNLKLTIQAPLAFFKMPFYGFGEHLVVQVLEAQQIEDTEILKTISIDREDLYNHEPANIFKERWYVRRPNGKGTGLTYDAAIRSMTYFMSKDITSALGA